MSRNDEVATLFEEFADLLDAKDVAYKPRSYRNAAENIREHHRDIEALTADGQDTVEEISGVGDAISSKIIEYFETGEIAELEALRAELPVDMAELTAVEGVGPKTVGKLYEALGITTLDELEEAAKAGKIQEVSGFGAKTEENILENIPFARESQQRELLGDARPLAESILAYFEDVAEAEKWEVAGSLRRWKATIGDIDILAGSDDPEALIEAFTGWPDVDVVIESGTKKASVRSSGLRIDLRVVDVADFGAALQYFTGSKAHNVHLRNVAIDQDLKMNEYGVFDVSGVDDPDAGQRVGERIAGETEESMYDAVGVPWMPPELREDRGEIEAALDGTLPTLVEERDIRGDLHLHTEWSDGNNTIAEMVEGAAEFGHEYLCISDHATGPGMVGGVGLDDEELLEQLEEIRSVAADADIEVFAGVEANIDADGGISIGDEVAEALDIVVASPHSGLDGDATDRLVTAVSNPDVNILGHPTGRLLNQRSGLEFDIEAVAKAAAKHETALEINANPHRLDLSGSMVQQALKHGATISINTDAHSPASYSLIRYGVHTARRGWAEADDVVNTWPTDDVREFIE
ncbi:DNA polymerase/3'-5' exonuclease PolX [Haladaptatus sp. DYSN1]|uniref:DNA polymerase/3'-5' exonuclease PolX n=1 Tax=unclassified Haladaptatus TaxID=2622732 RepID=UPI002406C97D|nr:DNA polymerase/3'-5' exonuclease PolX [Haladaptatus sp. DYSN1]